MHAITPLLDEKMENLARKRASAKWGWYQHALVYGLVNAGLVIASLMMGKQWHWGPLLGWGLGLAIHGMVVFGGASLRPLRERLLEQERSKIRAGGN